MTNCFELDVDDRLFSFLQKMKFSVGSRRLDNRRSHAVGCHSSVAHQLKPVDFLRQIDETEQSHADPAGASQLG